jgi:hypothetical protein
MKYLHMEVRFGNVEIRQRAQVADERDSLAIVRIGKVGCIDGRLVQWDIRIAGGASIGTLSVSPAAVARASPRRISCGALEEQQRSQIRFKVPMPCM